jgi:hypothetical protein
VLTGVQLGLGLSQFALVNELIILVWLGIAAGLFREYRRLVAISPAEPRAPETPLHRAAAPRAILPRGEVACA